MLLLVSVLAAATGGDASQALVFLSGLLLGAVLCVLGTLAFLGYQTGRELWHIWRERRPVAPSVADAETSAASPPADAPAAQRPALPAASPAPRGSSYETLRRHALGATGSPRT